MAKRNGKDNKEKGLVFCIAAALFLGIITSWFMGITPSVAEKILAAKTLSDLKPYPELKVFPKLLQAIRSKPENADNFEALFHYNAIRDGGHALYMYRDSFMFFFCEHPSILYVRFNQTGDERILQFCNDVLYGYDPLAFSESGYSLEEKQKAIKTLIQRLQSSKNTNREKQYLQILKKYEMVTPLGTDSIGEK